MEEYKNILVCLDLTKDDDHPVMQKALAIADSKQAKLSLIHVIENPTNYGTPYEVPAIMEWQNELETVARTQFEKLGEKYHIPKERRLIPMGWAKQEILAAAEKLGCDLIVMGSHGRQGLNLLLLGSTANAVLHGAKCDVLAVRTGKEE